MNIRTHFKQINTIGRIKRMIAAALTLCLLIAPVPPSITAYAEIDEQIICNSSTTVTVAEVTTIVENYIQIVNASGKRYWNNNPSQGDTTAALKSAIASGDYTSCLTSSACSVTDDTHDFAHGCTSNRFSGICTSQGSQCAGFADYMAYLVFQAYGSDKKGYTKLAGDSVPETYVFKPGDLVRYRWRTSGSATHSVFVYKVQGDNVSIVEANWNGRCHVNWRVVTRSSLLSGIRNVSGAYIMQSPAIEATGPSTLSINPTNYPTGTLTYGNLFSLQGTVTSNYPINYFQGTIYNSAHTVEQTVDCTPNAYSVDIRSSNVNQNLLFGQLTAGSYYMSYYATDTSGNSAVWWSDWFTVSGGTTKPAIPVVSVPQSTYDTGASIPISWNAVAGNEYYVMDIYRDGTPILQTAMGQETTYTHDNAAAGSYTVYVSANNSAGWSGSSSCSFTVRDPYTIPGAPTISASRSWITDGQMLTISWNAVDGATSYEYFVSEYPFDYAYQNYTLHGTTASTSLTFQTSDIPDGRYCIFLHAHNPAGDSEQSNWLFFDVYDADYYPTAVELHDGHIYAIYDQELTWTFAEQLCEGMGGHLVTITSQEENDYIAGLIARGAKGNYWIGARNDISGSWYDANPYVWVTGEEFSYTNWHTGEPNGEGTGGNKEHFAEICKSVGNQWNDLANYRTSNVGFVLEIDASSWEPTAAVTYGSSKYQVFDYATTWSEAEAYCEAKGGHLATVSSSEEDAEITGLLQNGTQSWYHIGGRLTDGVWKWLDDTEIPLSGSYANWSSTTGDAQNGPTGWGDYLMKYKAGTWIGLQNCYMPVEDMDGFGFVMEIDNAVNTLTFDPNGGTVSPSGKTIIFGEPYGELPTPSCDNCIFDGWFTEPEGGEEITADTIVNEKADQTLYAHWTHICADGHDFGPWTQTSSPTCTEPGYITRSCSRCGETESIEIAPLGHLPGEAVEENRVEPTATEEGGYDTVVYCQRCNAELSREHTTLPATGSMEPIETDELRIFSSISVGTDMVVTWSARKSDVASYEKFWIEVVKHTPDGDETYLYGADQDEALDESTSAWQANFRHIFAKEMGVDIEARVYAEDANGQIYRSPAKTTNIRDYLGGRLTATNNTVSQRVLAADLLNYGAAAQIFMNYDTGHLVNEELTAEQLAKLDEYETKGLPPVEKTNSNYRPAGASNILFNSVSLDNEVVLSMSVKAPENSNVFIMMKDHNTGGILSILSTTWSGSSYTVDYKGLGADKMRTQYDFVAWINGAETGNTRTWSIEGYVGELRSGSNQLQIDVANALLIYGDSAAAYFAAQ